MVFNQTVQNIQVNAGQAQNIVVAPGYANTNLILPVSERVPGWPDKWATPKVEPMPFHPPSFTVSLEQLRAALLSLSRPARELCCRGDRLAISGLLIEILRQIHADPKERNVYLNPRRGDQALVYMPKNWIPCPLDDAGQAMYKRIAAELDRMPVDVPTEVKAVALATKKCCNDESKALAKESRAAMSAHLSGVLQSTLGGSDWLGVSGGGDDEPPAFFGMERTGHLQPESLAIAAEAVSELYDPSQVTEETGAALASRALLECARRIIYSRPSNLTILPTRNGLYVHRREGWEVMPRNAASAELVRNIAAIFADQLVGVSRTPLHQLRPWLTDRVSSVIALDAGRILEQYENASRRYYSSLLPLSDQYDRRESARKLIAENMGHPLGSSLFIPAEPASSTSLSSLSCLELEDMLGFSLDD